MIGFHRHVSADHVWAGLMADVLRHGVSRPDRTGHGTKALFGTQIVITGGRYGLFPAVTLKQLFTRPMWGELAGFLRAAQTLEQFHEFGCHIWDENARASYWSPRTEVQKRGLTDVGRIYGAQWREWRSAHLSPSGTVHATWTDQMENLLEGLKKDPYGRRHIVTALNPGEQHEMCLPPCHVLFQCFVEPEDSAWTVAMGFAAGEHMLHMRVDMRSVDLFLGLPFDIASYATLQAVIAKQTGMKVGDLVFQMGDTHLYSNAFEAAREVIDREPYFPPALLLMPEATVNNFVPEHCMLVGYQYHPTIKVAMAV
jgi:thymidylate synthase